ncbi:hypothetical protein GCM10028827_40610 [Mucilaginibacter myungsuensis]
MMTGRPVEEKPFVDFHPLHVSSVDINYNKDGQFEVTCTIFTDDFEDAITKLTGTKADLISANKHATMDALVKKYIGANIHVKAGGTDIALNYLGFEVERESVHVYLESAKLTSPKKIDATVSLMHNLFDDQLNIVHITVAGTRKSGKLLFPAKTISQSF